MLVKVIAGLFFAYCALSLLIGSFGSAQPSRAEPPLDYSGLYAPAPPTSNYAQQRIDEMDEEIRKGKEAIQKIDRCIEAESPHFVTVITPQGPMPGEIMPTGPRPSECGKM